MIKSFLILISFTISLLGAQQIVLVVANDFNTSKALLECYEGKKLIFKTEVNIGKNGLGWGVGEVKLSQKMSDPLKQEGDKKAPAGIFKLTHIFGYAKNEKYNLPYLYASPQLICVDDSNSKFYNKIIQAKGNEKSFEHMKRNDEQYKYGVTVGHNIDATPNAGSCIFLHIQKKKNHATAGCTSMKESDLRTIINWLDKKKSPILIQIPKSATKEILSLYPQLKNSQLLIYRE